MKMVEGSAYPKMGCLRNSGTTGRIVAAPFLIVAKIRCPMAD